MQKHNTKAEYLETIGKQIRWKRAKKPLLYELESHILDRQSRLIEDGMEESEAETKAVAEMGDAETVGIELDRVHRPRPNWLLISATVSLFAFGTLLLWAVGGASEQFSNMLICGGIGIVFLILGYFCDYTLFAKYSVPIFAVLCAACLIFSVMGSKFLSTATQLCYALPFAYSMLLFNAGFKRKLLTLSLCGAACVFISILVMNGYSMVIYNTVLLTVIIVYAAFNGLTDENRAKAFIPAAGVFAVFALLYFHLLFIGGESAMWRVHGVLHPEADPYASGWVPLRVRELIDTSVFIGAGESSEFTNVFIQSTDFTNVDFMLATVAHKYGLILFIAVAVLLTAMLGVIAYGIKKQSCRLGKLTLLTVGSSFALRIAAYLMCNLGFNFISLDGIPLFSYSGKLMILDMFMAGIMLSVFRMESIARDSSAQPHPLHY